MDADPTAAAFDVRLEGVLLRRIEHVAGGAQPDHDVVTAEAIGGERRRILRRLHLERRIGGELVQHRNAIRGTGELQP